MILLNILFRILQDLHFNYVINKILLLKNNGYDLVLLEQIYRVFVPQQRFEFLVLQQARS